LIVFVDADGLQHLKIQRQSRAQFYLLDDGQSDTRRGIEEGRFKVENLTATLCFIASGLLGVMDYLARGKLTWKQAEQTTVAHLRLHGISEEEAKTLLAKRMPKLKRRGSVSAS